MEISIQLELNEVNAVLDSLGQMPTSTNVWPLANKIRSMAEAQLPKPDEGITDAIAKPSSAD